MAIITVETDPEITLGPLSLTWHGVMIAAGIVVGGLLATVYARERGLERQAIVDLVAIVALAGVIGARIFYLAEHGQLLRPGEWLGTFGFSIYGAVILGPAVARATCAGADSASATWTRSPPGSPSACSSGGSGT